LGVVSVGELERTTEPVPVDVVAPVPPFAAVSGFCSVRLLNVGEGYVWASAIAGAIRAARMIFFMDLDQEMETTPSLSQTTPGDAGSVAGMFFAQAVEDVLAVT
jgi:hypothetical protein